MIKGEKNGILLAVVILIALVGLLWVANMAFDKFFPKDQKAKRILETCRGLKPGISIDELITALGKPEREGKRDGVDVFYFKTPVYMPLIIQAEVNKSKGTVDALWCGNETGPTWELNR